MRQPGSIRRSARLLAFSLAASLAGMGAVPGGEEDPALGVPSSVTIGPEDPPLKGRRATRQLIVTARDADGKVRDLTRALSWTSLDPAVAAVSARGQVVPKGNGTATIVARGGSIDVHARVRVEAMGHPAPVSFRRDVIPALSQAGCNTGACHGTPTGKGGFRLSLRGYLPDQDFLTLSREAGGRRITPPAAQSSPLLRQAPGEVPPEGGVELPRDGKSH